MDLAQERRPSGPGFCIARDRPHRWCPPALGCSVHPDRPSQSLHACPSLPSMPTTGLLGQSGRRSPAAVGRPRCSGPPHTTRPESRDAVSSVPARPPEERSWAGCEHPGRRVHSGTLGWGRDLGVSSESARSPQGRTCSLLWCLPSQHSRRRRNRAGAAFKDNCQHVGDTGAIWLSHPRVSGLQPTAVSTPGQLGSSWGDTPHL